VTEDVIPFSLLFFLLFFRRKQAEVSWRAGDSELAGLAFVKLKHSSFG
jgi:hypothetical protein